MFDNINVKHWNNIIETFEKRYQHIVPEIKDWYPSGRDEITVVLNNGTKLVYDHFNDKLRNTYVPDRGSSNCSEDDWTKEFSLRLKNIMKDRRISGDQLSNTTGISKVSISKYLNGKAIPSVYNAKLIAKALDCPMYDLYEF